MFYKIIKKPQIAKSAIIFINSTKANKCKKSRSNFRIRSSSIRFEKSKRQFMGKTKANFIKYRYIKRKGEGIFTIKVINEG